MRSLLGRFHRPMSRGAMGDMLTMNSLGDGSTLSLDFTTGVLDSRLTFTRSTTATYINSSGYVTSAAINAPRFDYSPTTIGEPRGLLIEGQTANPILYSQDFSQATWSKSNATATVPTTAPDGTTTAYLLTSTTAGGTILQTHAATGNATSTYSIYVKQGTAAYCDLYIYDAIAGATRLNVRFTFATKVFTVTAGSNAAYQELPNGWFRISATCTALSTTNNIISYLYVGFAVAGTTYYGWGAQLEAGSGASSYIPTGASQVTRTTDSCLMSGTNFSSWFNNTEGTCLFVGDNSFIPAASNFATNWALINAANSQRIHQYTRHTSGRVGASARNPGGTALTFDSPYGGTTEITTTAVYKTAFALKTNDFAYSINGQTAGLGDASNGVFETVTSIEFARDAIRNGHIKQFKFYPTRLANAELQTLTAP